MGKQAAFLKDIADATAAGWNENTALAVGQYFVVDNDPPSIRAKETGNRVDQRGLSGPRTAKQRGQPTAAVEGGVEQEITKTMGDRDTEHVKAPMRGASPARSAPRRPIARRARSRLKPASAGTRRDRRPAPEAACRSRSARSGSRPVYSRQR